MNGGVNANLLFKWRRDHVRESLQAARDTATTLLPVCVIEGAKPVSAPRPLVTVAPAIDRSPRTAIIEVEIAGAVLRLRGAIDEAMLGGVLRALRQGR